MEAKLILPGARLVLQLSAEVADGAQQAQLTAADAVTYLHEQDLHSLLKIRHQIERDGRHRSTHLVAAAAAVRCIAAAAPAPLDRRAALVARGQRPELAALHLLRGRRIDLRIQGGGFRVSWRRESGAAQP